MRYRWTAGAVALLGTAPDKEVAERLGIGPLVVANKRHRLHIPACRQPRVDKTLGRDTALLVDYRAGLTLKALAHKYGLSKTSVCLILTKRQELARHPKYKSGKCWSPEELTLLGTASDREVAGRLGLNTKTVMNKRHSLGIPAHNGGSLVGQRFGRLVVLALAGRRCKGTGWLCACDCGGRTVVARSNLRVQRGCGCLRREHRFNNGQKRDYKTG